MMKSILAKIARVLIVILGVSSMLAGALLILCNVQFTGLAATATLVKALLVLGGIFAAMSVMPCDKES